MIEKAVSNRIVGVGVLVVNSNRLHFLGNGQLRKPPTLLNFATQITSAVVHTVICTIKSSSMSNYWAVIDIYHSMASYGPDGPMSTKALFTWGTFKHIGNSHIHPSFENSLRIIILGCWYRSRFRSASSSSVAQRSSATPLSADEEYGNAVGCA